MFDDLQSANPGYKSEGHLLLYPGGRSALRVNWIRMRDQHRLGGWSVRRAQGPALFRIQDGREIALTKSCARILGPSGVRVNAISPGFIRTEMIEHLLVGNEEEEIARTLPVERIGEVLDVGATAV